MLLVQDWIMRGFNVDLRDIVVNEIPDAVDLYCDEVLQEDQEEEQQLPDQVIQETYEVSICCGICQQPINFVCLATISAVRQLQELLFGPLSFVCVRCVIDRRLHHGG